MATSAIPIPAGATLEPIQQANSVPIPDGATLQPQDQTATPQAPSFLDRFLPAAGLPSQLPQAPKSFKDLALAAVAPAIDAANKATAPMRHAEALVQALKKGDGDSAATHLGNLLDSFVPGTGNALDVTRNTVSDIDSGNAAGIAGTVTGTGAKAGLAYLGAKGGPELTPAAPVASLADVPAAAGEVAGNIKGAVSDAAQGVKQTFSKTAAEAANQPAAAGALEQGATDAAANSGVTTSPLKASDGVRTLLDQPISALAKTERAAYDTINKASGTDLKSLYDHASDVQEALDDPTNIGQASSLKADLKVTQDQIVAGEKQAVANGIDPSKLADAKKMTQQRYAIQNVKQKLFNNESVVSGNTVHGAPETIKVDAAIRQVENLDKPSRYTPEGTPTRLQQALGTDGAKALKQGLYDAQKAGQETLSRQQVIKGALQKVGILGGIAAGGDAIVRALH